MIFRFGPFELDPRERRLLRDGQELHLQPKTFDTLALLVERNGHLVDKDALMAHLWPDQVVTEHSLTRCIREVRKVLGDKPGEGRYIETLRKSGYRFVAAVEAVPEQPADSSQQSVRVRRGRGGLIATIVASFIVVALLLWFWMVPERPAEDVDLPVLAILPFENRTTDSEQELLLSGLVQDLRARLASSGEIALISEQSSAALEAVDPDHSDWPENLNADWLLTGAQIDEEKHRTIVVELHSAETGNVWQEVFRITDGDMIGMAEALSQGVAESVGITLPERPRYLSTAASVESINAHHLYLMSRGLIAQRRSADLQQAIQTLHEVLELKPDHAGALAALGIAYVLSPDQFYPEGVARERANGLFDEAVEIDPDSALAWAGRALLAISQDSDLEQVKVYIDRALELNPYDADVLAWAANLAGSEGRVDAAFEYLNRALAVDPLHVTVSGNLSFNLVRQGRYEQAKALLDNAEARLGDHPGLYYFKVGVALSAGELETALTQAQEAVLGWPQGQFFAGQLAHVYARLQMDEEAMFWVLYARDLAGNDEQSLGASLQAYGDLGDSQSIHELVNTLRAHPQFNDLNPGASPRWLLAQLVEGHGRLSECAEVRAFFPLLFESPGGLQGRRGTMTFSTDLSHWMAWCLLRDGETERAMAWLDEVTTQFEFMKAHGLGESTDDMYFESRNRFLGGDTEGALDVLEAILDLGWLDQGALENDPRWDGLRHEARFIAALRAVTLRTREIRETIIDEGIEQDFQDRWAAIR